MLKKKNVCLPATLELSEELLDVGVAVPRRGHPRRQSLPVGRLGPPPPGPLAQGPHDLEVTLAGRDPQGRRAVVAKGRSIVMGLPRVYAKMPRH